MAGTKQRYKSYNDIQRQLDGIMQRRLGEKNFQDWKQRSSNIGLANNSTYFTHYSSVSPRVREQLKRATEIANRYQHKVPTRERKGIFGYWQAPQLDAPMSREQRTGKTDAELYGQELQRSGRLPKTEPDATKYAQGIIDGTINRPSTMTKTRKLSNAEYRAARRAKGLVGG